MSPEGSLGKIGGGWRDLPVLILPPIIENRWSVWSIGMDVKK